MVKLVNRAKMTTPTTGTGTITLGSAAAGFQTFAAAGLVDGDVVRYVIEDGDDWEIGTGTYTATGTTLTRTVIESSNSDAPINLSGNALVFLTVTGADLQHATDMNQGVATTDSPSFAGLTTTAATITGGTINGTTIGATTPSSGAFTSITGPAVTQSETDTTAGRLMKVGDFGLGSATGILLTDADDLNDIRRAGFYYWEGTSVPANAPATGNWFTLIVLPSGADNSEDTTQLVFRVGASITTNSVSFVRCYGGGSWQAWLRNYVGSNILGSVSQSGGVPTGAIIERGSNANGQFVRYADGTAEAILRGTENRSASGTVTTVVTLPMSFINAAVSGNTTGGSQRYFAVGSMVTSVPATASSISVNNLNTTSLEVRILRSNSTNTSFIVYVNGRWF